MKVRQVTRIGTAILLAPVVPSIMVGVFAPVAGIFYALLFGLPTSIVFGLPTYFILQKLRLNRLLSYVVAGFIAAIISELVYFLLVELTNDHPPDVSPALSAVRGLPSLFAEPSTFFIGLLGGIAGLTFWLIARPDQQQRRVVVANFSKS